jgi:hypothetical protein
MFLMEKETLEKSLASTMRLIPKIRRLFSMLGYLLPEVL